jgi:two-component system, NarL family, sensor histidine kinase UhpB
MLDRLERERRESARRALSAQEQERRRVARELHDEVGEALTAVLLQLDGAERELDGAARNRVREARDVARATLEEVRAIARGLRPEALDDLGLASALWQLCTEAERSGVTVRRSIASQVALETEAEVVVYRVAQEAITNALRHSGAEAVDVVLAAEEGGVVLTVRDDGRGFAGEPVEGSGLRGMRERALLAGGRLDVAARPGGGTDVTLRLP